MPLPDARSNDTVIDLRTLLDDKGKERKQKKGKESVNSDKPLGRSKDEASGADERIKYKKN